MSDKEFLSDRRQALEDAFFRKEEERKVAALRKELGKAAKREELRAASGMTDDAVLDKLVDLGVSGDTAVALSLAPLIHVALADGTLDEGEERAIVKAAKEKGITEGNAAHEMLAGWLALTDSEELFKAWAAYIGALGSVMEEDEYRHLEEQIVTFAREVAASAGGFLGVGAISRSEKAALEEIEAAFTRK